MEKTKVCWHFDPSVSEAKKNKFLSDVDYELHPYYEDQRRRSLALIDCWGKFCWYCFWLSIGFGMCYAMYKGIVCSIYH